MSERDDLHPAIRRLCVGVDLKGYHALDADDQNRVQGALMRVLEEAADATAVPRVEWSRQPGGDGELGLLPPGIDEIQFVHRYVRALRRILYLHNRKHRPTLRIRLSLHQGYTRLSQAGWAGDAVVTVMRLCDAPDVKRVLEVDASASLVVVVSQQLFADVIGDQEPDLNRDMFSRLRIDMPQKDFRADAWVHVPGRSAADLAALLAPVPPDPEDATPAGTVDPAGGAGGAGPVGGAGGGRAPSVGGNMVTAGRDAAGGDLHTSNVTQRRARS